jgi:hypothetical protein
LAANGLRAVIELSVPMQTAPLAEPGSLRPSPVSALTTAENFSAVGLVAAVFEYPGQWVALVGVRVGAPMVVLPPESQWMVPPTAKAVAVIGVEPPPVLPPVHPLTVSVLAAFPVIVVHRRVLAVHEIFSAFNAVIEPSVPTHTSPVSVPGISMPSPVSPVTEAVKLSAEGLVAAFFTYPGQWVAATVVSAGTPLVVVEPETQVTVPPVARLTADNGCELPPVFPPVHPEMTRVLEAFPVKVVQVIFPVAAPAVPDIPKVRPAAGMSMAATVNKIRRMYFLSYVPGMAPTNRPPKMTLLT